MIRLAAPAIVAAHVAALPTLAGWGAAGGFPVRVFEGAPLTREGLRRWCTVGFVLGDDAADVVHLEPVVTAQQQTREAGSISSNLVVAAADVAAARAAIFPLLAAWAVWLRADAVGAAGLLPGSQLTLAADVTLTTTRAGGTANAVVTTSYTATTYGEDTGR